jgi:hypothetical protein
MSYRGVENWYGNVWTWLDGVNVLADYKYYVCNEPNDYADDTSTNYTLVHTGTDQMSGYPDKLADNSAGFFPTAVGGSTSSYVPDYWYDTTGNRVVLFGQDADNGLAAGAFAVCSYDGSGGSNANVGAVLAR